MAKQTINIGTSPNKGNGDPLRTAFTKINQNFDELYARDTNTDAQTLTLNGDTLSISGGNSVDLSQYAGAGGGTVDRSWTDPQGNIFNVVDWDSGAVLNIVATPFETQTLTTFDSATNSNNIYFVWNQNFIDDVWEGILTQPQGERFSVSFDGGTTWFAVERNGYNGGTFFYFAIPFEFEGQYTFTYTLGQNVLIRYNRGSVRQVWFDIANSPVNPSNVVGVSLDVVVKSSMEVNSVVQEATVIYDTVKYMNVPYNNNTGEGTLNVPSNRYSGNQLAANETNVFIKINLQPGDEDRLYANFDEGYEGTLRIYWNAKLYTLIPGVG